MSGLAIKYTAEATSHNSAGDVASAVYLIANPDVGIDEVVTHSVPGLESGADFSCNLLQLNYQSCTLNLVFPMPI